MRPVTARLAVVAAVALCVVTAATPDPSGLVERLGAPTARARQEAEDALAALGDAALPALERAAAESGDLEIRTRALRLLERLRRGEDRAADAQDAAARRRAEAAQVLRKSVRTLRDFAAGTDVDRALAELAPESSEALAAAVVADAGRTLLDEHVAGALVRRPVPASLDALAGAWLADGLAPSAALRAAAAVEPAVARDPALREAGLRAAARLGGIDGADAEAHADRRDAEVAPVRRRMRVALVAAFAGARAAGFLSRAAGDADPGVRVEAVRALGRHLPGAAAETLRRAAGDPDLDVRVAALEALRAVPGPPRPEPAVAAATDPAPRVRRAAAELLSRDATPDELPVLAALAEDPSASVRHAARAALRRLSR